MKKEIIYVADDGKHFTNEEECLAYENKQKVPAGVYLYTDEMKPITSGFAFEDVYRMYIATEEGLEWVRGKCREFGLAEGGLVVEKHLYYDNIDLWFAFEDDIADYEKTIAMAYEEISRYKN